MKRVAVDHVLESRLRERVAEVHRGRSNLGILEYTR